MTGLTNSPLSKNMILNKTYDRTTDSIKTTLITSSGENINVDSTTNDIVCSTHALKAVHEGKHFYVEGHIELDTDDEYYVKLVTPNTTTRIHFLWEIVSNGLLETTFDEDATGGMTGGTVITPLNNNRNSNNTSSLVITKGVSANTGYTTRLSDVKVGGTSFKATFGGSSEREDELILKQNTTYCRSYISRSDNNIISFRANWIEQTNV